MSERTKPGTYDPTKKANPKKKPHPWGVWAPGLFRNHNKKGN